MNKKENRIFLEDQQNNFLYQKSKSNLNITFNRISFIFFIFFIIFVIYSIHLIHLGSRQSNLANTYKIENLTNDLYIFMIDSESEDEESEDEESNIKSKDDDDKSLSSFDLNI